MLYRFENSIVIFKDIITLKEYSFDLPKINRIEFVTINKTGTHIAFTAYDFDDHNKGIFLYDILMENIQLLYNKTAYDLMFHTDQDKLYFNSGNTINIIDIHTGIFTKLVKFSSIEFSPMSLCISEKGNYLSYHKWKSNRQRLYIYDLLSNKEFDMGISFYGYSWLDNQHIIYSLRNGLIVFNVNTKKSEKIIRNAKSLLKQYLDKIDEKYIISTFNGVDLVIDKIEKPVYCNTRIYFEVFLLSGEKKHIGIYSITKDKTDLRCHFSSNQGLISDYGLLSDEETIYIFIEPNRFVKETIDAGVIYVKDNQIIDYLGWLPVRIRANQSRY